jgi:hypothetical protein
VQSFQNAVLNNILSMITDPCQCALTNYILGPGFRTVRSCALRQRLSSLLLTLAHPEHLLDSHARSLHPQLLRLQVNGLGRPVPHLAREAGQASRAAADGAGKS